MGADARERTASATTHGHIPWSVSARISAGYYEGLPATFAASLSSAIVCVLATSIHSLTSGGDLLICRKRLAFVWCDLCSNNSLSRLRHGQGLSARSMQRFNITMTWSHIALEWWSSGQMVG